MTYDRLLDGFRARANHWENWENAFGSLIKRPKQD